MFREDSLCAVLSEIAKAQEMNMREGVKMLLELPERDISIYTDPARLGQVVNNLINNAVKFTQKGSISLGCNLLDDGKVEIYVRDTGTGMSGEVLSHIFERFFKGDAFVQGTCHLPHHRRTFPRKDKRGFQGRRGELLHHNFAVTDCLK